MNKAEFLKELAADLHRMKDVEKNKFTNYYEEMIADYTENGISEEDAVQKIGDPKKIAEELLNEYDSVQIKLPSTGSKILNVTLIIIGFPLWGSILLAAVLMILSAYMLLWCIPFITGVGCIGFFTSSLIGIIGSPFIMAKGISAGIMQLGAGVALTGISILLGIVTIILSKKFVIITKNFSNRMISLFRRKVVVTKMIQKYKKKCMILSLILIVTGTLISIIGFGTAGFHYSRLKESAKGDVWYQTIHTDGNNLWYGIKLDDDINLFVIGNSD